MADDQANQKQLEKLIGSLGAEQFDAGLRSVAAELGVDGLLSIQGVYEVLSEELNNEAIDKAVEILQDAGGVAPHVKEVTVEEARAELQKALADLELVHGTDYNGIIEALRDVHIASGRLALMWTKGGIEHEGDT